MEAITIAQAQKLTSPHPFGLLCTRKEEGSCNLMAVSWWTFLSNHPPMLGVCLSKKGLSGSLIQKTGEFSLCIVDTSLRSAAKSCGSCSGREHDKSREFGIAMQEASQIKAMLVSASRAAFECRLVSQTEAGDHTFYLAEILACHGDTGARGIYSWDGYSRLDPIDSGKE